MTGGKISRPSKRYGYAQDILTYAKNFTTNLSPADDNVQKALETIDGLAIATTVSIGDGVGGSTPGSVLFADSGSDLAQDNANLFWDDTNKRLGIGTSSPLAQLHTTGTAFLGLIDLGTNTIDDGAMTGNWSFGSGNLTTTETGTFGDILVDKNQDSSTTAKVLNENAGQFASASLVASVNDTDLKTAIISAYGSNFILPSWRNKVILSAGAGMDGFKTVIRKDNLQTYQFIDNTNVVLTEIDSSGNFDFIDGDITTTGTAYLGLIDLGTNTIDDGDMTGSWNMNNGVMTNVNIDTGNIANAVVNTEWDAAYTHSQDNTQAHSDYVLNAGGDDMAGDYNLTSSGATLTVGTESYDIYNGIVKAGSVYAENFIADDYAGYEADIYYATGQWNFRASGNDIFDFDGTGGLGSTGQINLRKPTYSNAQLVTTGRVAEVKRVTADVTLEALDNVVFCNGTFTVTLPAGTAGTHYKIINAGTGTITIDGNASETVYGETTQDLSAGDVIDLHFNSIEGWW